MKSQESVLEAFEWQVTELAWKTQTVSKVPGSQAVAPGRSPATQQEARPE